MHKYDIDRDAGRISAVSQRLIDEAKNKTNKKDKKNKKDKNIDAINAIYAVFHGAVVASVTAIYEKHNPTKLSDFWNGFSANMRAGNKDYMKRSHSNMRSKIVALLVVPALV